MSDLWEWDGFDPFEKGLFGFLFVAALIVVVCVSYKCGWDASAKTQAERHKAERGEKALEWVENQQKTKE